MTGDFRVQFPVRRATVTLLHATRLQVDKITGGQNRIWEIDVKGEMPHVDWLMDARSLRRFNTCRDSRTAGGQFGPRARQGVVEVIGDHEVVHHLATYDGLVGAGSQLCS